MKPQKHPKGMAATAAIPVTAGAESASAVRLEAPDETIRGANVRVLKLNLIANLRMVAGGHSPKPFSAPKPGGHGASARR